MAVDPKLASLLQPMVADPARTAILLDLDGTLAPIVERPDEVDIPGAIRRLLPELRERYGVLAFVSGRAVDQLRRIVDLDGVAYSGNHGWELRLADGRSLPPPKPDLEVLRAFVAGWMPGELGAHGVWLEDKGPTLTFHYRTAPDPPAARAFLERRVAPAAASAGLVASPGRMSLEVHAAGAVSKGTAAAAIIGANGTIRNAVSIGDDRTDTDVWRSLRALVGSGDLASGIGIAVTSAETPPVVVESADALIEGVGGTERVLRHLAAAHPA